MAFLGALWCAGAAPALGAGNAIRNGDFSAGMAEWPVTVRSEGMYSGYPKIEIDTNDGCATGRTGDAYLKFDVPGHADGYVQQEITVPAHPGPLTFLTWGNVEPPAVTISAVTAGNVAHELSSYSPPALETGAHACSGASPVTQEVSLAAYAGQTIGLRIEATSAGDEGTIAGIDNLVLAEEGEPAPAAAPKPKPSLSASSAQVICNFTIATSTDTCTATVADAGSAPYKNPTGGVRFTTASGGLFPLGDTCSLQPTPLSANLSSCSVQFIPLNFPSIFPEVTVTYPGDGAHAGCAANTVFGSVRLDPAAEPAASSVVAGAASPGQLPQTLEVQTTVPLTGSEVQAVVGIAGSLGGVSGGLPSLASVTAAFGASVHNPAGAVEHAMSGLGDLGGTSSALTSSLNASLGSMLGGLIGGLNADSYGTAMSALASGFGSIDYVVPGAGGLPQSAPQPGQAGTTSYTVPGPRNTPELVTTLSGDRGTDVSLSQARFGGQLQSTGLMEYLGAALQDALAGAGSLLPEQQVKELSRQAEAFKVLSNLIRDIQRSQIETIKGISSAAGAKVAAAREKGLRLRPASPLAGARVRNVGAGRLKLRLHLSRTTLNRLSKGGRTIKLYVRISTALPSRLLSAGYPTVTLNALTLRRAPRRSAPTRHGHRH